MGRGGSSVSRRIIGHSDIWSLVSSILDQVLISEQ